MGILVKQTENRSQYQERLAAELRERVRQQANTSEPIDQTKNSNYLKNTSKTSDRLWLWVTITGILLVGFAVFIVSR